jgi:hypothetical protein
MTKTSIALVTSAALLIALAASSSRVQTQMTQRGGYPPPVSGFSKEGNAVTGESGNVGVFAVNISSNTKAYLGARCCAGDFYGDVYVHGNIKVDGAKNFVIDHPLAPADKYLYHASVESSELKNFYDGVVTLDRRGRAVVELPEWFGALNKDFRYQLTPIGAPGPTLHIAKEIAGNQFTIAGGAAGMKVSWLVTGIRQDRWANANPLAVEVAKPSGERGRYLNPEVWGQPADSSVEYGRYPIGR